MTSATASTNGTSVNQGERMTRSRRGFIGGRFIEMVRLDWHPAFPAHPAGVAREIVRAREACFSTISAFDRPLAQGDAPRRDGENGKKNSQSAAWNSDSGDEGWHGTASGTWS